MFFLPSRGRPGNMERLQERCRAARTTSRFLVLLDEDDEWKYSMIRFPQKWGRQVAPPMRPLERIELAVKQYPYEDVYGFLGDDAMPETLFWDQQLVDAAGKWSVAYGADGDKNRPDHIVVGGELVRALGWVVLPGLKHIYLDSVWEAIGKALGVLKFVPEVTVEHLHPSNGQARMDKTYKQKDDYRDQDRAIFETWRKHQFYLDVHKIRQVMNAETYRLLSSMRSVLHDRPSKMHKPDTYGRTREALRQ